ncbi:MAG: tetratricopeptide repeat protein [Muribaculaceae bacterium]|nr:tetratricopeptide repeat protein [Muribaculaceae bacterium]
MNKIKKIFLILALIGGYSCSLQLYAADKEVVSTKKERNHITKGNKLYEEGKFKEAQSQYRDALEENPASIVGRYNLGLTEIQIGSNPNDTSATAKKMMESGIKNMEQVANLGGRRPDLASKANYNLGNVAFNSQDFQKAIDYYKKSLRLNPEDDNARRNLRIAQLKIQNQDQNQDQQDQEDQQDQQEDNQDQNQDQEQNQDQNQDQQDNQDNQQEQQPQSLNQQTAEQILNAIENKENQTRARVAGQNAEKSRQRNRNKKNW